jgi:acyl-CoA dehydrogenase
MEARFISLISFCPSEPDAGSDVAGLQLLAEKDGSDYVLSGTNWIQRLAIARKLFRN